MCIKPETLPKRSNLQMVHLHIWYLLRRQTLEIHFIQLFFKSTEWGQVPLSACNTGGTAISPTINVVRDISTKTNVVKNNNHTGKFSLSMSQNLRSSNNIICTMTFFNDCVLLTKNKQIATFCSTILKNLQSKLFISHNWSPIPNCTPTYIL